MLTFGLKHDKIWAQWVLDIPLESMLEKVWWILKSNHLLLDELFKRKKTRAYGRGVEDCIAPWNVARKGRNYYQLVLNLQEGMDIGQP
jgi:hypothetical protein